MRREWIREKNEGIIDYSVEIVTVRRVRMLRAHPRITPGLCDTSYQ